MSEHNQRLRWLTGFSGAGGSVAVVTRSTTSNVREEAVLWTDARFTPLADEQLDCSWQLRQLRSPMQLADWLLDRLSAGDRVGADAQLVLHQLWDKWYNRLCKYPEPSFVFVFFAQTRTFTCRTAKEILLSGNLFYGLSRCISFLDSEKSIELVDQEDLVDHAWRARPPRPRLHAFVHKMGQRGKGCTREKRDSFLQLKI